MKKHRWSSPSSSFTLGGTRYAWSGSYGRNRPIPYLSASSCLQLQASSHAPSKARNKNTTNRRRFRGAAVASAASYGRILGANERVQLGLIGCGERGRYDMSNFVKAGGGVDVVALCDVWGDNLDRAKTTPAAANARTFTDHHKVLEIKELDVALICVPDHWPAPIAIDALNAGKDVYVEK